MVTMKDNLTPKQEEFAQKYIELEDASKAYRAAYNVSKDAKIETIHRSAHDVFTNPKVAARIAQLQEKHAKRHEVTIDSLTKELEEALKFAYEKSNPTAVNSAIMAKAKLHGLDIKKVESKHSFNQIEELMKQVDGSTALINPSED